MEVSGAPELSLLQLLIKDALIGKWHDAKIRLGWEHAPAWLQEHISRNNVSLKHALIQEECTERFADDHIDRLKRNLSSWNVFDLLLNYFNHIFETISFDKLPCYFGSSTCLTSIDFLSSCLSCEKRQNSTSATNIHDSFTNKIARVFDNSISITGCSHCVLEHVLLISQLGIVAKVLFNCRAIIGMDTSCS